MQRASDHVSALRSYVSPVTRWQPVNIRDRFAETAHWQACTVNLSSFCPSPSSPSNAIVMRWYAMLCFVMLCYVYAMLCFYACVYVYMHACKYVM